MCQLRRLPATPVLCLRRSLPAAQADAFYRSAFAELERYALLLALEPPGAFYTLNTALPGGLTACEAGFALPGALTMPGSSSGIRAGEIPAGAYACALHRGPYDQCGATRAALLCWARGLGWHPRPAVYEWFYRALQHLPAELHTEIWLPLEPARAPAFNLLDERVFQA